MVCALTPQLDLKKIDNNTCKRWEPFKNMIRFETYDGYVPAYETTSLHHYI